MRVQSFPLARYLMILLACTVSWQAARLAYASWLGTSGTLAALRQATRLWPHHGGLHRALAELDPLNEQVHLAHAATWRPRAAEPLIALSLVAENDGDLPGARRLLDRASSLDRGFRPVWAKLNLLARLTSSSGRDEGTLWSTARQAFAMSHRDRTALLELCWSLHPDGGFLVREVIGRRPPVLFDAVGFLMSLHQLSAAHSAFQLLLDQPYLSLGETNAGQIATPAERLGRGLDLCDLQLDLRDVDAAWQTWQGLRDKGLLLLPPGRGFDWRRDSRPSKGSDAAPSGAAWQLRFTGGQPDETPLLWRYLPPLKPGSYRVAIDVDPPAALHFPAKLVVRSGTPARIHLTYRRAPGTLPFRGSVRVGDVHLSPIREVQP